MHFIAERVTPTVAVASVVLLTALVFVVRGLLSAGNRVSRQDREAIAERKAQEEARRQESDRHASAAELRRQAKAAQAAARAEFERRYFASGGKGGGPLEPPPLPRSKRDPWPARWSALGGCAGVLVAMMARGVAAVANGIGRAATALADLVDRKRGK